MKDRFPTTVYRAIRRPDGRIVCVDVDYLHETTKVVQDRAAYLLATSLGWSDHPTDAMQRKEAEEDQISEDAAVRHFDDRHLSDKAKAEAEEAESHTIRHLPEIPEAPKKGRPKKSAA